MKLSDVQSILHMLLREDLPIRQLGLIFERGLGDYAPARQGTCGACVKWFGLDWRGRFVSDCAMAMASCT